MIFIPILVLKKKSDLDLIGGLKSVLDRRTPITQWTRSKGGEGATLLWQTCYPACSAILSSFIWGKGLKSQDYIYSKATTSTFYKTMISDHSTTSWISWNFYFWISTGHFNNRRVFWRTLEISSSLRTVSYEDQELQMVGKDEDSAPKCRFSKSKRELPDLMEVLGWVKKPNQKKWVCRWWGWACDVTWDSCC